MCGCNGKPEEKSRKARFPWRKPRWLTQLSLTRLERAVRLALLAGRVNDVLEKHGGPHVGALAEVLGAILKLLAG